MSNLNQIVKKYTPYFYIHSQESLFPTSLDNIILSSKLYKNNNILIDNIINVNDIFKNNDLDYNDDIYSQLDDKLQLRFEGDTSGDTSIKTNSKSENNDLPCIVGNFQKNLEHEFIYLHYLPYFIREEKYNNDHSLITIRIKCDVENDIINNNIKIRNDEIDKIFIKGREDGMWYNPNSLFNDYQIEQEKKNNRFYFYISQNHHSIYPVLKKYNLKSNIHENFDKGFLWNPVDNVKLLFRPEFDKTINNYFVNYYSLNERNKLYSFKGLINGDFSLIYRKDLFSVNNYDSYFKILKNEELKNNSITETSKNVLKGFSIFFIVLSFIMVFAYSYIFKPKDNCNVLETNYAKFVPDANGNFRYNAEVRDTCNLKSGCKFVNSETGVFLETPTKNSMDYNYKCESVSPYNWWYFLIFEVILIVFAIFSNITGIFY